MGYDGFFTTWEPLWNWDDDDGAPAGGAESALETQEPTPDTEESEATDAEETPDEGTQEPKTEEESTPKAESALAVEDDDAPDEHTTALLEAFKSAELPDGVELNVDAVERMAPVLANFDPNNPDVGEIVSAFHEMETQREEARFQEIDEQIEQERIDGLQALKDDPIIGGTEANYNASMRHVTKALQMPGGREFATLMRDLGRDNDMAVVGFLRQVGMSRREDSIEDGGSKAGESKRPQDALFGIPTIRP